MSTALSIGAALGAILFVLMALASEVGKMLRRRDEEWWR